MSTLVNEYETSLAAEREANSHGLRCGNADLESTAFDYMPSREFLRPEKWIDSDESVITDLLEKLKHAAKESQTGLPTHLDRMCQSAILTSEEEVALFRQMNFHKFQASLLNGDPTQPSQSVDQSIDLHLERSREIRDVILQSNIRLVMSIAKKFVTPFHSFDDLLSDGIMTMMQTVEKFDYSRGFRFSTYAYRSIARSLSRKVARSTKERSRFTSDADEWAFEQEQDRPISDQHDEVWSNVRDLTTSFLERLDRREQFIIRSRFALGAHRKTRSFQYLADKLGVSKERVRQLANRAIAKLQSMADTLDMDELFGAAMA